MVNVQAKLRELVPGKQLVLRPRGNDALLAALKIAKKLGKTKVILQDQGGWLTYRQYPEKLGMEMHYFSTDAGLFDSVDVDKDSVLLVNSMPGYHAYMNMKSIYEKCKAVGCLVINDVSGSIGNKDSL